MPVKRYHSVLYVIFRFDNDLMNYLGHTFLLSNCFYILKYEKKNRRIRLHQTHLKLR